MSQTPIPEFAETELWVVRSTLKERDGHVRKTKIKPGATPDKSDLSPFFWGD